MKTGKITIELSAEEVEGYRSYVQRCQENNDFIHYTKPFIQNTKRPSFDEFLADITDNDAQQIAELKATIGGALVERFPAYLNKFGF